METREGPVTKWGQGLWVACRYCTYNFCIKNMPRVLEALSGGLPPRLVASLAAIGAMQAD